MFTGELCKPWRMMGGVIFLLALAIDVANADELESKPFAEHKVVLQISDASQQRQSLLLNVANNLINHYGPDAVDVEIVAFGPGLQLLFAENRNGVRIDGLSANGVRFAACSNTFRRVTERLGHEPSLHAASYKVPAGVVRIIDLVADGYTLIKP